MKPGEGYMIFLSSDESVTLYYSDDETLARKNNIAPEYNTSSPSSNHYSYIETGIPHAVVVKEIIINNGNFQLVPGDEIALFDEDVCVGSATFDGNYPFNITAWRSYSDAGLNGYSAGNPIDAVLYITDADIEIELSVESINGSPIKYGEGAYAYILLNGASDSLGDLNTLLPNEYSLEQNYPNPFNPITNIKYHVPSLSNITIKVYNVQGEKVCTLVDRYHDPGYYDIAWDGEDNKGIQLASGIYFSEMRAINTDREYVEIRKMTLLK